MARRPRWRLIGLMLATVTASAVLSQVGDGDQSGTARWMAAMTPGEQHQWLAKAVGEWDLAIRVWAEGNEPLAAKGSAKIESILDGRFIYQEFESEFMGQPYRGIDILGYDNYKGKYVGTQMTSMGTAISTMEGFRTPGTDELVMWGTTDEPQADQRGVPLKYIFRMVDADHAVFEVHNLAKPATKQIEVAYTRK